MGQATDDAAIEPTVFEHRMNELANELQGAVGFKVMTLLKFNPERYESVRIYSNELSYPIGRPKQHRRDNAWSEHVVVRGVPFLAGNMEALRANFDDFRGIESAGCGATMSIPLRHGGRTVATLNLWHIEDYFDAAHVDRAAAIVAGCAPAIVRHIQQPTRMS